MIAKNCDRLDLLRALETVNEQFDQNITFKRWPEAMGRRWRFTLRAIDSKGKGGRLSAPMGGNQRRIGQAACWHVHGYFFDALFNVKPDASIVSGGQVITKEHGNWVDRNIGSMIYPFMYSEACKCDE